MVDFCEGTIEGIISAETENELEGIIADSLSRLSSMNLYKKDNYLMNMIVSLQGRKGDQLSQEVTRNVNLAIEILRAYRKSNQEPFF